MVTRQHRFLPEASRTVRGVGSNLSGDDAGADKGAAWPWGGSMQLQQGEPWALLTEGPSPQPAASAASASSAGTTRRQDAQNVRSAKST